MTITRILGYLAIVLVVVGLGAGFVAAGSPQHARELALDDKRVSDLWTIAQALRERSEGVYGALAPATLPADIVGAHADGSSVTTDPQSHAPYEYKPIGGSRYELCATFALATDPREDVEAHLRHRAGRSCYVFDVRTSEMNAR